MFASLTKLLRRTPAPSFPVLAAVDNNRVTPSEREQLREWLKNPTTILALGILEATRPPVTLSDVGDADRNSQRAFQTMGRLQGWTHYRNSLLLLGHTPKEVRDITETYPDQR